MVITPSWTHCAGYLEALTTTPRCWHSMNMTGNIYYCHLVGFNDKKILDHCQIPPRKEENMTMKCKICYLLKMQCRCKCYFLMSDDHRTLLCYFKIMLLLLWKLNQYGNIFVHNFLKVQTYFSLLVKLFHSLSFL